MVIDFHTHLLPGIDDGSRNASMTEAMLREEAAQGVSLVAATPHFYPNRMSVEGFLERRAAAMECAEQIRRNADDPLPEIVCGAEVFYFRGIGQAKMTPQLCIGSTETLLLELPFEQWESPILEDIRSLLASGLQVVLAHVERYFPLQRSREVWNSVMALPVMKQLNAGSFLKPSGLSGLLAANRTRAFCLDFLRDHPETMIGSDCHNLTGRKPNLAAAREVISARLGAECLSRADQAVLAALGLQE